MGDDSKLVTLNLITGFSMPGVVRWMVSSVVGGDSCCAVQMPVISDRVATMP